MGLTFADLQNLSREATVLYPPRHLPVFTEPSDEEQRVAELQLGISNRLRNSPYYIVERVQSTDLPRYSDKYRPSLNSQPQLKRKDLHAPFFPEALLEEYFNPRGAKARRAANAGKTKINLDDFIDEGDDQEKSSDERSDAGSQPEEDYDVDEEYDNDYAENYFDNGEGDDMDDLGGGGGDDGGGGMDYD
ncbi:hypothetical protein CC1G_07726 [Coprinopsis cinerea okayama7|uniref:DNA-directed RNA polymerase III subunit n=1 Tax=Coprinopsis cinerea (strain Okayama-7 / 130 / ATCC MYA-4618 / FGSC 9003) TaxID=240176 RepID=A8NBX9_COPC7|nr:hypothetical protein CC1G_07726 [Coprinopsis cinerea okayama7\|eukprot:XP_001832339.1 hypothetical protein CC1G_07726 [Coprinopsis cinerea okayama7\